MKKAIKWTLFGLLLGGIVALSLCYIIIPERTKSAIDIVVGYLNTPLGIAGGSTITIGLVLGIIIKYVLQATKTSIKDELNEVKEFNAEVVVKAQEFYELGLQKEEEIKELISSQETKYNELKSMLLEICETSPNAKIKSIGEKAKQELENIEQESQKVLNSISIDFPQYEQGKNKVQELQDKINELTEKLERLVEQYEENERIDSNPKEE